MKREPSKDPLRFAVLATDTALFTIKNNVLHVRVVHVARPPHFPNNHGLPGGLLLPKETAEEAAARHLRDKAGVDPQKLHLEQLYTFSKVDRDPRGRVVAVAYLGLVPWSALTALEQADSTSAKWLPAKKVRGLAYDHDEIVQVALHRLASRASYTTVVSKLMPLEFTLTELEHAYESILGTDLDKRNFRKKILAVGVLKALGKKRTGGRFRPAELYRFSAKRIEHIEVL